MRTRIRELADPDLKDCVPTSINSPLKDYRCLYLYEHLMPTCLLSLVWNFALSWVVLFTLWRHPWSFIAHTHGKMKYIFSSNKVFEVFPDHLHSYLKVYLRYLAFAFETLHYPWIPSFHEPEDQFIVFLSTFCRTHTMVLHWEILRNQIGKAK